MEANILKVREVIQNSDAIIITAGAGMGVDSGLPDFRGNDGFWKAYPPIAKLGYEFSQMANPTLFKFKPKLAWGFYGHRLNLYRSTIPHRGFKLLLDLVKEKNDNYFIFTSNVDGQFQKSGFNKDKIYEVHGNIHHLQCTKPCKQEIWKNEFDNILIDMDKLESKTLPKCKYCSNLARPNILMFGDWNFVGARADKQADKFYRWRDKNKNKKIVIIEVGAGSEIATIRNFGDEASNDNNITLVRINPREYNVHNNKDIGIALSGLEGISKIYR